MLSLPPPASSHPSSDPDTHPERARARAARDEAKRHLGGYPQVVAVGLTRRDGVLVVKVNLSQALPDGALPAGLLGVPLITEVVGTSRKQATMPSDRST